MKRIFALLLVFTAVASFTACDYDDNDLWNKVNDLDDRITSLEKTVAQMNGDIASIKQLVNAVDSGMMISKITETDEGYKIEFTDGTSITIKNGTDGADGISPVIGVAKHSDDKYYWTVTIAGETEWLKDADGSMIAVSGEQGLPGENGENGADGETPVIGVDAEGFWIITLGGTTERIKDTNGYEVKATGSNDGTDSLFESIIVNDDFVTIKLKSGESFTIPVANFSVSVVSEPLETFLYGQEKTFVLNMENVDEYSISKPTGWRAVAADGVLTVTAPVEENTYAEQSGEIVISVVSNRYYGMAKFAVEINSALPDDLPSPAIAADGFYVVNEDWFGHDKGTVNFFGWDGSITYRAYRKANDGAILGVTTPFATIYGDHAFFVSKQGNRLVVADANTLRTEVVLTDIGGDGRAFVGVSPDKGYISTLRGITVFHTNTMTLGSTIAGISDETGNMLCAGKYVFAVTKLKGVNVIDTETDSVHKLINGNFSMLTQSKDGRIWVADADNKNFLVIDPHTLDTERVSVAGYGITSTWFAWTPGSLCASTQENAIYYINGGSFSLKKVITKYDIDRGEATEIYTLGTTDSGGALKYYGAGMRVDPLTDRLILTTYVTYPENYVYVLDNQANFVAKYDLGDDGIHGAESSAGDTYYWFPSMAFFKDMNEPEILLNGIVVEKGAAQSIDLNEKVVDADNISASIHKHISDTDESLVTYALEGDTLTITAGDTAGKTSFTLTAVSNGKTVTKSISVSVK